jgi:integrase
MRRPYSLLCRKGVWYSRIFEPIGNKYLTAKSTGTRNLQEAKRIAIERVSVYRGDSFDSKISICKFCEEYWDWSKSKYIQKKLLLSPGALSKPYADYNRAHIQNYIKKYFRSKTLDQLRVQDLDDLLLHLVREYQHLSRNTINKIIAAVLMPLKEAYRLHLTSVDPSRGIYRVGTNTRTKGVFTTSEIQQLSSVEWDNEAAFLAFKLSAVAGLRLGEIRALRDEDIADTHIVLRHSFSKTCGMKCPKNGKVRIVPIPSSLLNELRKYALQNQKRNGWVFWSLKTDAPIGDKTISGALYRAMVLVGITEEARQKRNLSFHSLRHFFNTTMRGHVSEEDLRATMGHSSIAMTDHYDHASRLDERKVCSAQDEFIMSLFKNEVQRPA